MSAVRDPESNIVETGAPHDAAILSDVEKDTAAQQTVVADRSSLNDSDAITEEFQDGVKRVRAITAIWSKKTLASMFAL